MDKALKSIEHRTQIYKQDKFNLLNRPSIRQYMYAQPFPEAHTVIDLHIQIQAIDEVPHMILPEQEMDYLSDCMLIMSESHRLVRAYYATYAKHFEKVFRCALNVKSYHVYTEKLIPLLDAQAKHIDYVTHWSWYMNDAYENKTQNAPVNIQLRTTYDIFGLMKSKSQLKLFVIRCGHFPEWTKSTYLQYLRDQYMMARMNIHQWHCTSSKNISDQLQTFLRRIQRQSKYVLMNPIPMINTWNDYEVAEWIHDFHQTFVMGRCMYDVPSYNQSKITLTDENNENNVSACVSSNMLQRLIKSHASIKPLKNIELIDPVEEQKRLKYILTHDLPVEEYERDSHRHDVQALLQSVRPKSVPVHLLLQIPLLANYVPLQHMHHCQPHRTYLKMIRYEDIQEHTDLTNKIKGGLFTSGGYFQAGQYVKSKCDDWTHVQLRCMKEASKLFYARIKKYYWLCKF